MAKALHACMIYVAREPKPMCLHPLGYDDRIMRSLAKYEMYYANHHLTVVRIQNPQVLYTFVHWALRAVGNGLWFSNAAPQNRPYLKQGGP